MATATKGGGGRSGDGDRPWQSFHTAYTNAKAGMEGVDKEKVQKIIYEMSKGSKYFENEQRKEALTEQKIEHLHAQCAKLADKDIAHFQKIADNKILELEATRDLSKIWLHTDMDAFFAAVEILDDPSLKGKPIAVGSMSMISTASYEARKFGVRAAMPGFIGRRLCPDLIFVPPNFDRYTHYSKLTREVFRRYDPEFIAASLDEAHLDITETCVGRGMTSEEVAAELRSAIHQETGLTCSVGVAPNRLLAKVCSDINKPNGQFILPNDRGAVMTFISTLPIRKIGGIGKVTEHLLRDVLGISTCQEMLQKAAFLCALFSDSSTDFFLSVGLGIGGTETPEHRVRKSISCERTFTPSRDSTLLFQKLADIAESLSDDMQKECLKGRTLTLKLKTASFEVRTRAVSIQKYINSKEEILTYATKLLKAELPISLRLMGLRMSQLFVEHHDSANPMQKTLDKFFKSRGNASRDDEISSSKNSDMFGGNISSVLETTGSKSSYMVQDDGTDLSLHQEFLFSDDDDPSFPEERNSVECSNVGTSNNSASFDQFDGTKSKDVSSNIKPRSGHELNEPDNFADNKHAASSGEDLKISWIDGYICSLCGFELPLNFEEERQEHSDFHLAEVLQRAAAVDNMEHHPTRERVAQKASLTTRSARKRQKASKDGKHIPIDLFFLKGKKNV